MRIAPLLLFVAAALGRPGVSAPRADSGAPGAPPSLPGHSPPANGARGASEPKLVPLARPDLRLQRAAGHATVVVKPRDAPAEALPPIPTLPPGGASPPISNLPPGGASPPLDRQPAVTAVGQVPRGPLLLDQHRLAVGTPPLGPKEHRAFVLELFHAATAFLYPVLVRVRVTGPAKDAPSSETEMAFAMSVLAVLQGPCGVFTATRLVVTGQVKLEGEYVIRAQASSESFAELRVASRGLFYKLGPNGEQWQSFRAAALEGNADWQACSFRAPNYKSRPLESLVWRAVRAGVENLARAAKSVSGNSLMIAELLSKAPLSINFKLSDLKQYFLKDGLYRTAFQIRNTWPSAGNTGGPMAAQLYNMPQDPPSDISAAKQPPYVKPSFANPQVFNNTEADLQFFDSLPKFAALDLFKLIGGVAPRYGECAFVLKDIVKKHATAVFADTNDAGKDDVKKLFASSTGLFYLDKKLDPQGMLRVVAAKKNSFDSKVCAVCAASYKKIQSGKCSDPNPMTWERFKKAARGSALSEADLCRMQQHDEGGIYNFIEAHIFIPHFSFDLVERVDAPFLTYCGTDDGNVLMGLGSPKDGREIAYYLNPQTAFRLDPEPSLFNSELQRLAREAREKFAADASALTQRLTTLFWSAHSIVPKPRRLNRAKLKPQIDSDVATLLEAVQDRRIAVVEGSGVAAPPVKPAVTPLQLKT